MAKMITYKEAMKHFKMKRASDMYRLRYGKKKHTYAEIGRIHGGLSRQRVYQIMKSAEKES